MTNIQPGQMLSNTYQVIGQVGKGGMATVYKAYHAAMDRYVAIKVLPHEFIHNEISLGRFKQEVRLIAKLEHPRILPVYDYGESDGTPYLVMRYLDAGTLKDRMLAGPLSLEEIDHFLTQLAEGLGYAHKRGVIHRDIKPSNAMVDEHDDVFLTDFGVARLVEGSKEFTATGALTGTPAYMSPEQAQGQKVDQRSDIYSLGIVLYEMLTQQLPFDAETPLAVILKKLQQPLPPPSQLKPGIYPAIEAVVLKALAKDPDDRYETIQDFLLAWKQALSEKKKTETERDDEVSLKPGRAETEAAKPFDAPAYGAAELPPELMQAINSSFSGIRAGAVLELERLLHSSNPLLAKKAYSALQRLANDDSKQVSTSATASLARQQSLPGASQAASEEVKVIAESSPQPPVSIETLDSLPMQQASTAYKPDRPVWLLPTLGLGGLLLLGVVYLIINSIGKSPYAQTNPTPTVNLEATNVSNPAVDAVNETPRPVFTPPVTLSPGPIDTLDSCAGATASGARQHIAFEQIVPCLNTVQKVSEFMQNNITGDGYYDIRERGGNEYVPASLVYQRGIDDCDGLAILQCYFLERNGMDAAMLGLSVDTPVGYNVCAVKIEEGTLILDGLGLVLGPFPSNTEIANFYIKQGMMTTSGTLKSLKASQVTQITTDFTKPNVLELPWISLHY